MLPAAQPASGSPAPSEHACSCTRKGDPVDAERWRKVAEVCSAALERPAAARAAFVAASCGDDPELRRDVEALLAVEARADGFLDSPLPGLVQEASRQGALVGRTLGTYRLEALIGAGGMGDVYRARDTRLDRAVAVKILPPVFAHDPDRLAHFRREAHLLAALNHPNVVTIHDVGADDGTPYVVTELLEGQTLREWMAGQAVPAADALDMGLQVARGLAAAHRKGIVHRDLKPENLFLTADGRVKVLDFSVATLAPSDEAGAAAPPGVVMGTVAYMAPEHVEGRPVDARTDVFALGVVLYEMLAGAHPFARDTPAATIGAILRDEPRPLDGNGHGVAAGLDRLVRRCLHKAQDLRFHDAQEVAAALEALWPEVVGGKTRSDVRNRSPYPGLRPFTDQDTAVFFGREAEVEAQWEKLRARRLLAVIGPSGAGKSSFVRAGVAPAAPDGWAVAICTPGPAPLRSLGRALAPLLPADADALQKLVAFDDHQTAFSLVRRWREAHDEALVIIDQFEELFTLSPADVQARVAEFLGRLVEEAGVRVLLSMRDDFLVACSALPPLSPALADLTALRPLGLDALRRAIVDPARLRGYRFDDESLASEMASQLEGARAALPLLAFAVARLWERRDPQGRVITRASYEAIGGVAGALAQHAEATLEAIGPARHDLVREILRNLVTADGTRAVVERDELLSVFADRQAAAAVLDALVDARLLTAYEVEGPPGHPAQHRVEIVHESLLTAWPRLVRWRTQDQEGALLRDHLRQAAHLWDEKGRSADLLWTGRAFREFALWRERHAVPLTEVEGAFASAMVARDRRAKRLRWAAVAALVTALAVVAAAIGVSREQALAAARHAEAARLAALGRLELDRYPTAAVAYALHSLETADTPEGRQLALEAVWRGPAAQILPVPAGAACSRVAFSPDGGRLACAGFPDKVVVWNDLGQVRVHAGLPTKADVRDVAFDPGGQLLVSWVPGDDLLRVWSADGEARPAIDARAEWVRVDRGEVATLGPRLPGARERVLRRWSTDTGTAVDVAQWVPPAGMRLDQPGLRPLAFDRRLRWLAFADGHDVLLRALGTPGVPDRRLARHGARVREVVFDDEARHLLSLDESGLFCLWTVADRRLARELRSAPPHRYSLPVFSPDGHTVAWVTGDGSTVVWNLAAPAAAPPAMLRRTDVRDAGGEAFDPQGRWLASAAWDSVALWPRGAPRALSLPGHVEGPILDLAFSNDSRTLASCARDGARLWPLDAAHGGGRRVTLAEDFYCYGLRFAPDGRHLALSAPYVGVFLVPLDGGPPRQILDYRGNRSAPMPLAFDASGRTLAVAPMYAGADEDMTLQVADLEGGGRRTFPLRAPGTWGADGYASSASYLRYVADGRLLIAGSNGLRRWNPSTGAIEPLMWGERFAAIDTDRTGSIVVALLGRLAPSRLRLFDPELLVLDGAGRVTGRIASHGHALTPTIALDPGGHVVVTGDANGVVRVGPVGGGEPHLLTGHSGPVNRVAVSPDGRWIASASGGEIRLWPRPDFSKPPLHTLPRERLLDTLGALTNLRVVRDPLSATGWSTEVGPFPGWRQVPAW